MDKLTVRDFDAGGKRVFVRVDFNVPLEDGKVTDDSRIRASIPTIRHLVGQGARVVLASHLGRPNGKVQDGLRLRPVAERLSQLLRINVPCTGDALGIGTEDAVKRLKKVGKPAGILTPNVEEAKKFISWGYTFVAVGADLGLLAKNADALAKTFKTA